MNDHFTWNDDYAIGHETVDGEHRHLLDLANAVLAIENPARQTDQIKATVLGLYRYMETHFANEEALMRDIGFPELDQHAVEHKRIIENMNDLLHQCKNFYEFVPILSLKMQDWVLRHILEEDKAIGLYIEASGVAVETSANASVRK